MQVEIDASKRLPTNKQLAKIWPPWNALPAAMSSEEKCEILKFNLARLAHPNPARRSHFEKLKRHFDYLPLCWGEYNKALEAAAEWHRLKGCITANDGHAPRNRHAPRPRPNWPKVMEAAQRYDTLDDEAFPGRVALYRVAKELRLLLPGFLDKTEPTLADIKHLHDRFAAYHRARRDGVEILSPLIFAPTLLAKDDLPFEKQAFGLPNPPARLARHLYIARLASFGKCSHERLVEFMAQDFLKLSAREMKKFCDEYHDPQAAKGPYYHLFVWAWLAENAPVFNICEAKWPDIFKVVKSNFTAPPTDAENLKIQWRDFAGSHELLNPPRITPPKGPPRKDRRPIPPELLAPPPRFSPVTPAIQS